MSDQQTAQEQRALLRCSRCGRSDYAVVGQYCKFTQPDGHKCMGLFEPASQPVAPAEDARTKTVTQFWDGQKYRFCPKCQSLAFEFAEAYAAYRLAAYKEQR